jgi:hypothetical protein
LAEVWVEEEGVALRMEPAARASAIVKSGPAGDDGGFGGGAMRGAENLAVWYHEYWTNNIAFIYLRGLQELHGPDPLGLGLTYLDTYTSTGKRLIATISLITKKER